MNRALEVPADILQNVQQRWPDVAPAWANNVEAELHALCERFRATPRVVLPARYGFVIATDSPDGPLVFRSTPDPQGAGQAAVAVALAGLGISPAVHYTSTNGHGTWTVLDQVDPGTPLAHTDPTTVNLDNLFAPFAAMNGKPAPLTGMPTITDWLRTRLEDDELTDLRPGTTVAPIEERRTALNLLTDLTHGQTPGLCHGDASLSNILACGSGAWRLIDPRGMAGENVYDVAVLAIRVVRYDNSPGVVPYIAQVSGVDVDHVKSWMVIADTARV
jgi:streptomycin 6-kinase